jgi:hypothetical protein
LTEGGRGRSFAPSLRLLAIVRGQSRTTAHRVTERNHRMETNTLERGEMKFILDGRSFDTAAAVTVAVSRGHTPAMYTTDTMERVSEENRYEKVVYRTTKGAFFLHEHRTTKLPKGKPVVSDVARALTAQEAVAWIAENGAAIIDPSGLDLPEEA